MMAAEASLQFLRRLDRLDGRRDQSIDLVGLEYYWAINEPDLVVPID